MTLANLDSRVALVTGAANGLGHAIATCFGEAGAPGVGFDAEPFNKGLPAGWIEHRGDVVNEADLAGAVDLAGDRFGRLDIVVANAGLVPPWQETEHLDFEEWDTVFAVNVKGVAATIKHAVPLMKRTGGTVIVMGSLNSRRAHPPPMFVLGHQACRARHRAGRGDGSRPVRNTRERARSGARRHGRAARTPGNAGPGG